MTTRHCPTCDTTVITRTEACPWCDTRTEHPPSLERVTEIWTLYHLTTRKEPT